MRACADLPRPLDREPLIPAVRRRGVEVQPPPPLVRPYKRAVSGPALQSLPRPATSTGKQPSRGPGACVEL